MRIISQDGCYDMPYEEVALKRNGRNICALNQYLSSGFIIGLAEYSTEEKAIKAMDMCRKYYDNRSSMLEPKIFQFPKDEGVIL